MRSASGLAMRIVVLGAGNILLSDEGLGVRVIERLPCLLYTSRCV